MTGWMNKFVPAIMIALVFTVLLFLLSRSCNNGDYKQNTIDSLTLANQRLDSLVNKGGELILEQASIITSNQKAIQELTDSIFQLKGKTTVYYKEVTKTKLDSIKIPYKDTIAMRQFEDSVIERCIDVIQYMLDSMITVPRKVEKSDPNFRFLGTVRRDSFTVDSLEIPDTLQLRFVEKRQGLFKPTKTYVQFFHSNPYIQTTQANSVLYKAPKKKRILEKALLVGAGIFLGSKL